MANSAINLSSGERIRFSDQTTAIIPSEKYNSWAKELGVPADGTDFDMDGDDSAYYFNASVPIGGGNFLGFCSEGGIEIPAKPKKNSVSLPGSYTTSQSIPNIDRYYAADVGTGSRLAITFHPPYDAGSSGVKMRVTDKFCIIGGAIYRSGQTVNFAFRLSRDNYDFDLYLSTPSGQNVPVYAQELTGAGSYQSGSQVLLSTIIPGTNIHLRGELHQGILGGMVIDAAGAPAARKIMAHDRASGTLVGSTESDAGGSFVMKAKTNSPVYVVALDDAAAPDFNALIYDRVTPGAA